MSCICRRTILLLALVFTMIAGIVLGMGMPTTPAYIIMTALLVPAIVKFGVIVPAAHMFAFYFAILSAITPPVALAVFAAAGLAKSDLWATGLAAVRIAATSFIVPFMFVLRASAADDRRLAQYHLGEPDRFGRRHRFRRRAARLFHHPLRPLAERAAGSCRPAAD